MTDQFPSQVVVTVVVVTFGMLCDHFCCLVWFGCRNWWRCGALGFVLVHWKLTLSTLPLQIKLFDHRLIQKGAVQSYEGSVNSHTRIELGVDPSEKVVMSGENDFDARQFLYADWKLVLTVSSFQVERTAISVSGISSLAKCSSERNLWIRFPQQSAGQEAALLEVWYLSVSPLRTFMSYVK